MRQKLFSVFLTTVLFFFACGGHDQSALTAEPQASSAADNADSLSVLPASVAGTFYPANASRLKADIARYLDAADPPEMDGEIVGAIVPHAGYVYSAPVAAYAYKSIARRRDATGWKPDAVVILAFDHKGRRPGVSVYRSGAMETPLGRMAVNEKIASELIGTDSCMSYMPEVFRGEHSAEVQLPFLQETLPDVSVVPVMFGRQSLPNIEAVSNGLEAVAKKNRILVIASTDLSHFKPYGEANELDARTIGVIEKGDPMEMARYVSEHPHSMCGPGPVLALMSYAESQRAVPVLLKYANSGDTAGRKDAVVGYAAVLFVKKSGADPAKPESGQSPETEGMTGDPDSDYLTEDDKNTLLRLARRSVETFVRERKMLEVEPPASPRLRQNGAGFVTLKKGGHLRGCIGRMQATIPLYQTVIRMAIAAASQDHRFPPVRPDELKNIHIEISVNTPLRRVSGPEEIVLGKHGVVVEKGFRSGVFLPQVAAEQGWNKKEFLENLCAHKAGLPRDCYEKGADIYVFSSIVFEE